MKITDVNTGEVKFGRGNTVLRSLALGSCVAVIAYEPVRKIGGIAHIMLPGRAPEHEKKKIKYSENALDELTKKMRLFVSARGNIEVFIIGGGNVLKEKEDNIGKENIDSVKKI